MRFIAIPVLVICGLTLCPTVYGQHHLPQGFSQCSEPGLHGAAWCGTVTVPEDRQTRESRTIALSVAILPALGSHMEPDPVFWIEGGPGGSAIDDVTWWQDSPLRSERDLVYVDLRGTGRSNPLNCDLFGRNQPGYQHFLGPDMFPEAGVRRCAEALSRVADLRLYTMPVMMDDLDDVRAALGYDRINIVGLSGGTHSALVYLQRHPAHVRSIVLNGVVGPHHLSSAGFARYAQDAFDGLAHECAASRACHDRFPDVQSDAEKALAAADAGDAKADIPDPSTGKPVRVVLNRGIIAEIMRNRLYTPSDASDLPVLLHEAAQGNYGPIAEIALSLRLGAAQGVGDGVYFSVVCAEDSPWLNVAEEEKAAAGTFLGPSRVRQEAEACSVWPARPAPDAFRRTISSNVPMLFISGQLDPVTPASNADDVARDFPNSLRVVVPSGGHCVGDGLVGFDCIDRLQFDFINRGSVAGLDTACMKSIHRRAFSMKIQSSNFTGLDRGVAQQLIGTYVNSAGGKGAVVKLENGALRIVFDDGETLRLLPLSNTTFRVWGLPTRMVSFQFSQGKEAGFTIDRGGTREFTLTRAPS